MDPGLGGGGVGRISSLKFKLGSSSGYGSGSSGFGNGTGNGTGTGTGFSSESTSTSTWTYTYGLSANPPLRLDSELQIDGDIEQSHSPILFSESREDSESDVVEQPSKCRLGSQLFFHEDRRRGVCLAEIREEEVEERDEGVTSSKERGDGEEEIELRRL